MDVVGPVLDILTRLWGCIFKDVSSVKEFEENVRTLETGFDRLYNVSEDVKRWVKLEEEKQMVQKNQVGSWLRRVEAIDGQVKDVLKNANRKPQRSCCRGCPSWSSYKLGEEVTKMLKVVDELVNQGNFDSVADMLPRGPVDEKPLEETVGSDSPFKEVQSWMEDDGVKVIGIHGMGGVGKTTLLKKINNQLASTNPGFDLVIWITVSSQSSVGKVQEDICQKLKLPENMWRDKSEDEKMTEIYRTLRGNKFVLMLDDIWKRVDLVKIGVPSADDQEMSKVVFTTRKEDVCDYMKADKKIKIKCLEREEAFALFMKEVKKSPLSAHPDFPKLAADVAEECKGMPLALITVGRAMASKRDLRDWDRVIRNLRKGPSMIKGMEEEVYHVLKVSYDSLRDDTTKSCFIYSCLYPEDHEISVEDVVQLWIGEGFLDEFNDIHEARDQGCDIVETLKAANLLETGQYEEYVKMHDVIRDMALWISRESNAIRNRFVVINHVDLLKEHRSNSRMEVGRISLWGSSIRSIDEVLPCPTALTFLARDTSISMFPAGFSHSMPVLKVLDLSFNLGLEELPPAIDKLVELQLLNLSNTRIRKLPIELRNLAKMKYLLLNFTHSLEVIPRGVISNFSCLRVFRLFGYFNTAPNDTVEDNVLSGGRISLLEELECLQHINDISITVFDATALQKLQCSSKIQNCLTSLCFNRCEGLTSLEFSSSSVKGMRHLETLVLYFCEVQHLIIHPEAEDRREIGTSHGRSFMTNGYFLNLLKVIIIGCDNLLHCAWLIYAQNLELLNVTRCRNMVEIIPDFPYKEDSTIFSRLKKLTLFHVPNLHSVYPRSLPFPSLVEISVIECHSLRRLPFDSSSGKGTLKKIEGEKSWWDKLQWDDQSLEPYFRSYYVPFDK